MDRREYPRAEVSAGCRTYCTMMDPQECEGVTENLSRNGVLVTLKGAIAQLPRPGEYITIDIDLPTNQKVGQRCLACRGTVVRVARGGSNLAQLALALTYMHIRDVHSGLDSSLAEKTDHV